MGGIGSGDWTRPSTKRTVEDSLTVAMRDFRGRIDSRSSGFYTWISAEGVESSLGFIVTLDGPPTITLYYRWRGCEDVRIPVRLQTTPLQFGGIRWWFTCPLINRGMACNRRVGKLYLPPEAKHFGCRRCHDLTYRSCQQAHLRERLLASVAGD